MFRLGLIGIPVETVFLQESWMIKSAYIPKITNITRELIQQGVNHKRVSVEDLGELKLGPDYELKYRIDRLEGIPDLLEDCVHTRDMDKLEEGRKTILSRAKEYDLFMAVGPSHLGAIVLYEKNDFVARLDHHADYADIPFKNLMPSYASYMNWVENNVKKINVTNYFVHYKECGKMFGKEDTLEGDSHKLANHFDIDVDCFDLSHRIQDVYPHEKSSKISPANVLKMISEAKPQKIGIWEYRSERDYNNEGLTFILDTINILSEQKFFNNNIF